MTDRFDVRERAQARPRMRLKPHHLVVTLLLVSWLPATGLAQVAVYAIAPTLAVVALLTRVGRPWWPGVIAVLALLSVHGLALVSDPSAARPLNAAVALFMHGSALLLVVSLRLRAEAVTAIVRTVAILSVVEAVLAVGQVVATSGGLVFASMATGDHAVGTLLGNSHLFAVKMLSQATVLGTALLFGVRPVGTRVGFAAAILGGVLGSALFSTFLFLAAIVTFVVATPGWWSHGLRRRRSLRVPAGVLAAAVGVIALFALTQADNVRYAQRVLVRAPAILSEAREGQDASNQGKFLGTLAAIDRLSSSSTTLLLGTGAGHYSSRAALILSGGYLEDPPSFVPVSRSPATAADIFRLWNPSVWSVRFQDGVLNQPFYQLQTLVVEFGLLGFGVVVCFSIVLWRSIKARDREGDDPRLRSLRTSALALLLATVFIGLSENWLEYPHFIAPVYGLLTLARSPGETQA